MPSDNYDFTPWDSSDDIEKFIPQILAGAKALGGAAMTAGKTIGAAAKPALSAAGKGLQQGRLAVRGAIKDKVSEKLGGGATDTATSGAADAAESAASAIESQKPEITSSPDTASESSMNTAQPTEPKTSAKDKAIEQGMNMVQQSMADNKQQKQNQIDRASEMARRGASVQTGEPMNIAWRLLKEDDEYKFTVNDVINTPRHTWYSQIMGRDTPMVDALVDSGIMPAFGYDNHHHGDPGIISDFHEGDVSVDESLENLMNHRNSLMVLDARMQGKEDTIPQEFRDYHNNFNFTRMMENEGIPPHIQAAQHLAFLYSHLNYLGHKIGPQMGKPDDDFNMKYASEPMSIAMQLLKEDEDEVPDPKKFRMNQEDLVDAYREIARRRREAKNTMNMDDIKVHPGERPKPNKLAYSKREYFPTAMRHPDQSPGIARLVMHDDNNRGTFEGLPFKDDFIRGEPLDYALDILGY